MAHIAPRLAANFRTTPLECLNREPWFETPEL